MKKKVLFITMAVLLAATATAFATSTMGIGAVGYYSYSDLEDGNYDAYTPGLRAEFFFSDIFGLSFDAILNDQFPLPGHHGMVDVYEMVYLVDLVFRLPLGLIEPYIATGPAYTGYIVGDEVLDPSEEAFAYNVRGGVDVNLTDSFSLGIEANFLVDDVAEFIDSFSALTAEQMADMVKGYSKIGITAKARF